MGVDRVWHSQADINATLRQVQYGDMVNKGYSDIMYNMGAGVFTPSPMWLRGLDNRNAANGDTASNMTGPSVLFPWGPTLAGVRHIENWQQNAIASALELDRLFTARWGVELVWVGHRNWRPSGCPGDLVLRWILDIFNRRQGPPPPTPWLPDPDFTKRPKVGYGQIVRDVENYGYVHWVQMFLNATSPEGCPVDGIWGPISHDRLLKFQGYFQQVGFPCTPTGFTDKNTWGTIHWIATQQGIV